MKVSRFDELPLPYQILQSQRIEITRRRIASLAQTLALGRIIPDPADLPIGKGRRLEAAILFLDISDFTARAAESEAEQDAQVRTLSLFFSEMIRIVGDYGGTVEKNTGDGIMAYFGRIGTVDLRQRALASALTMFHAANARINPIIEDSHFERIRFRVCLDYGWITVARLGAAQRFNHIVAVGAAANRTSKMLSLADADEIVVGDAMLPGIPSSWLETYVDLKSEVPGWRYSDGSPYRCWTYRGRWK